MKATVFDDRVCALGEGLLWHPKRHQIFWFDIMGSRLMSRHNGQAYAWQFDEHVSAAGWTGQDTLLIASETSLFEFNLTSGAQKHVVDLEADKPQTRSNDGRADPWGGFWIGTMSKTAEKGAGAIYRFFQGTLRLIVPDITISNAICFNPNAPEAYYTDTVTKRVMRLPLNQDTGWPSGPAHTHLDLTDEGLNPDGAVTDARGNLWIAEWGAHRVSCYDQTGARIKVVEAAGAHTSCPAFGGDAFNDLYITTATEGLTAEALSRAPDNGLTFVASDVGQGRAEPQVRL